MATADLNWLDLEASIASEILHAPKTGGDLLEAWPPVHSRIVRYLKRNVAGTCWMNHLALMAAVLSAKRYDVATIKATMITLHVHLKFLWSELALTKIEEWNATAHFPSYLKGEIFPEDSLYRRMALWNRYNTATKQVWLESLPMHEKEIYQRFTFPVIPPILVAGLVKHAEVKQQQHQVRKIETDALVPHFAALRSEAHLRFNHMVRLRQAYQEALKRGVAEAAAFPRDFSYVEGQETLRFRIWDRCSFILAHAEHYSKASVQNAQARLRSCAAERDRPFLEFLGATGLADGKSEEGLWFTELLKQGVLGDALRGGSEEELERKRCWLLAWGYQEESAPTCSPFRSATPGLLCWSHLDGSAKFMHHAQAHCGGVLIPLESLYAAVHFGLLAVDLFTTTGMRIMWNINISSLLPLW